MNRDAQQFSSEGYVVIDDLLNVDEIEHVDHELESFPSDGPGDRRLLDREWCRLLGHVIRHRLLKRRLLYLATQPVLCTYFNKDADTNWGVNLHRDLHVPLNQPFDHPRWGNWSEKQGIPHAQAPRDLLATMLAVRVSIDACDAGDGALCVVPGSQATADVDSARIECTGPRGYAVVMSPLLLHASIKSQYGRPRRVLHFLFGPSALPDGAQWYYAP